MTRIITGIAGAAGVRRVRRLPVRVKVKFAIESGTCATLEGPVRYQAGDALVEGGHGDRWPVPREVFRKRYHAEPATRSLQDGFYSKVPETVLALQLEEEARIELTEGRGVLSGCVGDWVIERAPGRLAIVAKDIFPLSYEIVGEV